MMKKLERDGVVNYNYTTLKTKDGTKVEADVFLVDRAKVAQCNIRDITEKKKSEAALKASAEKLNSILNNITDVVWSMSWPDLTHDYLSPSLEKLYGRSRQEFIDNPTLFKEVTHPDDQYLTEKAMKQLEEKGEAERECRIIKPDGSIVWINDRSKMIYDENHQAIRVEGVARDITERKQAEKDLNESEEKFRLLLEGSPLSIIMHDKQKGEMVYANKTSLTRYGCADFEELKELGLFCEPPYSKKKAFEKIQLVEKAGPQRFEWFSRNKDGDGFWEEVNLQIMTINGVERVVSMAIDITSQKEASEKLQKRLETESMLAKVSAEFAGLSLKDTDSAITKAMEAAGKLLGVARVYIFQFDDSLTIMDNTHEWCAEGIELQSEILQGMKTSTLPFWMEQLQKFNTISIPDVSEMPPAASAEKELFERIGLLSVIGIPLVFQGKLCGFAGFDAVREKRQWEKETITVLKLLSDIFISAIMHKKSSENYEELFKNMINGYALHEIICDENAKPCNYRFLAVNPAFEKLTGLKKEKTLGKTVLELLPETEKYWIETYGRVALTGEPVVFENYASSLKKYFEVYAFSPGPGRFASIFSDITKRITAEKQKDSLQNQLIQSEKMAAVGQLAGGIAHDFNNILTSMKVTAQLLMEEDFPEDVIDDLKEINKDIDRAKDLVKQLLQFSRKEVSAKITLDLNMILESILKMLKRTVEENINIEISPEESLRQIKAGPLEIDKVIMTLVINARDALPEGGTISIKTENVEITPENSPSTEIKPGRYVKLTVRDNGTGMDKETKNKIFEPFFTTKAPGKGTGMGLSAVYGIVKESGGDITVETSPGEGSAFKVFLPAAQDSDRSIKNSK